MAWYITRREIRLSGPLVVYNCCWSFSKPWCLVKQTFQHWPESLGLGRRSRRSSSHVCLCCHSELIMACFDRQLTAWAEELTAWERRTSFSTLDTIEESSLVVQVIGTWAICLDCWLTVFVVRQWCCVVFVVVINKSVEYWSRWSLRFLPFSTLLKRKKKSSAFWTILR